MTTYDAGTVGVDAGNDDHDLDDGPVQRTSLLDELRVEVKRQVENEPITLETRGRPGWSVRYRADVETNQLNLWRKKAADRTMPDGVDEQRLACMLLANQCDAILRRDEEARGADGELLTFASGELQELMGVHRAVDAVKTWYGTDGHMQADSMEVLLASGFGEEAMRTDPTKPS